ncbi:MAG: universal stress protein [SAR324 cluster bacterium]|nr:universal stress protein [SAR324 cluster bacterium]
MQKKILVPIDYSDVSKKIITTADALAQQNEAVLYFIHVERHEEYNDQAHGRFEFFLQQSNITSDYHTFLRTGIPHQEILTTATVIKPHLIIMASHFHTLIGHAFQESNTVSILHYCNCPVYVYEQHMPTFMKDKIIVPVDYGDADSGFQIANTWAQCTGAELFFIPADYNKRTQELQHII